MKELAGIYDSDDVEVATDKLRALVERLVGKDEAAVVAGHLAILLGFETEATAPDRDSLFQSVRSSSRPAHGTSPLRSCSRTSTGPTRRCST